MRKATLILLASLFAGCTGSNDPATAEYWVDRLDDRQQRIESLKELGKIADPAAIPQVLEWFQEEGDWQPTAAYTLGQLGDKKVVPDLIAGIDFQVGSGNSPSTIRKNSTNQNIARALAMLKAPQGVDPLVNLLRSQELKTREAVIRSLGNLGDPRAADALVDIALNETQPFIRKTAIQALGVLRDPKGVPALIQNLFVELPGVSFYYEARYSLQQIGEPAIPALLETLERKNKKVEAILISGQKIQDGAIEAKAAFVLGALRSKASLGQMIGALDKYYKMLAHANRTGSMIHATVPGAVMELCYALGNVGDAKAVPLLKTIAMDTNPNIRVAATEALTTIGDSSAVDSLLKAARTGPPAARKHAILAVSRLGLGGHMDAYDKLNKTAGKDVPAEVLEKILKDERPRLEAAAECKEDVACWTKKATGDKNTRVRERAAYQLGWLNAKDSVPTLLKAAEDDDATVRMAAVLSLGRFTDNVQAKTLQDLHDRWSTKITYRASNAELRRLIARVGPSNGKGGK